NAARIRRRPRSPGRMVIQAVAQLLAGLEERDVLLRDRDAVASARVAADAGVAALHRERAETAQLDPVAACQRGGDLVENGVDDLRRVKEFRDTAAKLRRLARQVQSPDARRDLSDLAERFERMAERIDPENPPEIG